MVEDIHANTRIVRARQKRIAGAEAGADDAEVTVTLLLEPVEAGACVDDGLARSIDRAADIRRDCIIGTCKAGRHARIVIRKAQAQSRNAEALQSGAQRVVLRKL